jgi:hypothetical protein
MKNGAYRDSFAIAPLLFYLATMATCPHANAQAPSFTPPVTPEDNEAVIYFYRDSFIADVVGIESFYVNGYKACDLRRNEYSYVIVRSGNVNIMASNGGLKGGPPTLNPPRYYTAKGYSHVVGALAVSGPLVGGKSYFVEYKLRSNPLTGETTHTLKLIAESVAVKALAKCTLVRPEAEKLSTLIERAIEREQADKSSGESAKKPPESRLGALAERVRAFSRQ